MALIAEPNCSSKNVGWNPEATHWAALQRFGMLYDSQGLGFGHFQVKVDQVVPIWLNGGM